MKIFSFVLLLFFLSCSKNTSENHLREIETVSRITYDTTAIDSFGPGATSESVMAKINAVAIKRKNDSLAAIAKAAQEKLDKEKAEKEAQKAKEEKKELPKPVVKDIIDVIPPETNK